MRSSTTTRELSAFLSRPAFRAMEGVARQLGVRLPSEPSVVPEEVVAPLAGSEALTPPAAPGRPASVLDGGELADARSSPPPPPSREESPSAAPSAPGTSVPREPGKRRVCLLPRSIPPERAPGLVTDGVTSPLPSFVPTANIPGPAPAPVMSGATAPRTSSISRAETSEVFSAPVPGGAMTSLPPVSREAAPEEAPVPVSGQAVTAPPPSVSRREGPGAMPPSARLEIPESQPAEPVFRAGPPEHAPLAPPGPPPHPQALVEATGIRSTPASPPPESPRTISRSEPAPRIVRLLPRARPAVTSPRAPSVPSEEAPATERAPSTSLAPASPHAETATEPGGKGAPRARLTFLPEPEVSPVSVRSPLPPPQAVSGPAPSLDASPLTASVTHAMTPVWNQVRPPAASGLTAGQAVPPASTPTSAASGAARNTFNVNVHLDASTPQGGLSRRELEEALTDILLEAARRQGLEV